MLLISCDRFPLAASWDPNTNSGGVPQLKGARSFSFEEIKKCTNNFSDTNEVGNGGYGKVYILSSLFSKISLQVMNVVTILDLRQSVSLFSFV